jgi:hypothetical protein
MLAMGWQWSADPRDWFADHLDGRCGCDDGAAFCETGRALWRVAHGANVPLPAAGLDALTKLADVPRLFLN